MDINEAAAAMGRKGGASRSEKKAAAARKNGLLGGRPRHTPKTEPILTPEIEAQECRDCATLIVPRKLGEQE